MFYLTDKLSALLDEKKASKVAEKIFIVYDDMKAAHKAKKRSHGDDRDKDRDRDSKRSRIREEVSSKNEKSSSLSKDKVSFTNF